MTKEKIDNKIRYIELHFFKYFIIFVVLTIKLTADEISHKFKNPVLVVLVPLLII